jgi:anti-sigma factor (TIGR02949 family)
MPPLDPYTCAQAFQRLDDYLDRELAPDEHEKVREHLETCAVCAVEFRFEASVILQVRYKIRRLALPPGLEAGVWRKIAQEQRARARKPTP